MLNQIVLLSFLSAICTGVISTGHWSVAKEIKFLKNLSDSGKFFNTDKSFMVVLDKFNSSKYGSGKYLENNFMIIVQSSPDNGVFRLVYAKKCGEKYCPTVVMGSLSDIHQVAPIGEGIKFKCDRNSSYGLAVPAESMAVNPGSSSNYIVCSDRGEQYRYGVSGGSVLPVYSDDGINLYMKSTFPKLL